jgi:hypothetical protein
MRLWFLDCFVAPVGLLAMTVPALRDLSATAYRATAATRAMVCAGMPFWP